MEPLLNLHQRPQSKTQPQSRRCWRRVRRYTRIWLGHACDEGQRFHKFATVRLSVACLRGRNNSVLVVLPVDSHRTELKAQLPRVASVLREFREIPVALAPPVSHISACLIQRRCNIISMVYISMVSSVE